jgi:hypothetical protein
MNRNKKTHTIDPSIKISDNLLARKRNTGSDFYIMI